MKLPQNLKEHFKILELIHKTAKTEIWRVEEVAANKIFVLRIMYRKNLVYKYLANIKDKNLPEIIFVEETENATYVVEEFLNGENLADYIKIHGTFDEEKICQIGIELCSCLEKLHACHIIHRDIKPENLFFTNGGILKLIDFDIARIEKIGRVADTEILLTQGYAAPEQYGFQQTDERTDIYALGLTLKVLAGYQNYSGFLTPILKKCTSFDPDQRYNSAKDLKFAIVRSQRLNKFRKFFAVGAAIFSSYIFMNFLTQNEIAAKIEMTLPVEEKIIASEVSNAAENPSKTAEKRTASDFPMIMYPKSEIVSTPVYEPYTPPVKISKFDAEKLVAEITKKVDALNLEPPAKMSFRDFKNQMRNLNLSDEELQKKYAEHYSRIAMNLRISEFRKLLPKNLTDAEINAAEMLFIRQEKQRFNID